VACHPVPLLSNVPRAPKDAQGYADSTRDKHGANNVNLCTIGLKQRVGTYSRFVLFYFSAFCRFFFWILYVVRFVLYVVHIVRHQPRLQNEPSSFVVRSSMALSVVVGQTVALQIPPLLCPRRKHPIPVLAPVRFRYYWNWKRLHVTRSHLRYWFFLDVQQRLPRRSNPN
jgi:hypothetical protein